MSVPSSAWAAATAGRKRGPADTRDFSGVHDEHSRGVAVDIDADAGELESGVGRVDALPTAGVQEPTRAVEVKPLPRLRAAGQSVLRAGWSGRGQIWQLKDKPRAVRVGAMISLASPAGSGVGERVHRRDRVAKTRPAVGVLHVDDDTDPRPARMRWNVRPRCPRSARWYG